MSIVDAWLEAKEDTEVIIEPTIEEKAAEAYALNMRGMKIKDIAKKFKVDESTIWRWKREYARKFREHFEQSQPADIVAEMLLALKDLEDMSRFEANQLGLDGLTVDKETGEVKRTAVHFKNLELKNRFLQTANKALQDQINLLQQTGVIPKSPERFYGILQDNSAVEKKKLDRELTKEEMLATIMGHLKSTPQLIEEKAEEE